MAVNNDPSTGPAPDENTTQSNTEETAQAETTAEESAEQTETIDPLEAKDNEIALLNDKHLRLYSEFENFRRRTAKERIDLISTASADLMKELLPILDDFDRAIAANEQNDDLQAVKDGFKLIHNKLLHTMTQKGLKEMKAKEETFDPELHEAVTKIPAPKKKMVGKNVDVIEKGYYMGEKVIRYAKVVVGS